MKAIYNNLINGNLSEAKVQAEKVSLNKLIIGFVNSVGLTYAKARVAARYLKGLDTFQNYADSK